MTGKDQIDRLCFSQKTFVRRGLALIALQTLSRMYEVDPRLYSNLPVRTRAVAFPEFRSAVVDGRRMLQVGGNSLSNLIKFFPVAQKTQNPVKASYRIWALTIRQI